MNKPCDCKLYEEGMYGMHFCKRVRDVAFWDCEVATKGIEDATRCKFFEPKKDKTNGIVQK